MVESVVAIGLDGFRLFYLPLGLAGCLLAFDLDVARFCVGFGQDTYRVEVGQGALFFLVGGGYGHGEWVFGEKFVTLLLVCLLEQEYYRLFLLHLAKLEAVLRFLLTVEMVSLQHSGLFLLDFFLLLEDLLGPACLGEQDSRRK